MLYNKVIETNHIMFELKMTEEQVFDGLKKNFGKEFTAADVRAFCAMNDIGYSTVTKKIKQYKVGKGKWNLEVTQKVVDKIENSYSAPSVEPVIERNLVPEKDDIFVPFGSFADVKNGFVWVQINVVVSCDGHRASKSKL